MKSFSLHNEINIKDFKRGKRINKGGFGVVYQVEEIKTGKQFAAKVVDCEDDEEQCKKIIEREVGIMMCSKHPAIIKLIGYSTVDFHDENNVTIIMDLATNGSLLDVIKSLQRNNGPKDYTNTSRQIILFGVSRGMKYLHDRNIIHRDLKPGNILLDDNFHPLITDFGFSKYFEVGHTYSQTQFGGTIPYQAPEILQNLPYDTKVDVYAFAFLMYEVINDSFSYPELHNGKMSDFEFKSKVVNENYRPNLDIIINDSLRQLIEDCWSSNPIDRPSFDSIVKKLCQKDYFLDDVDFDEFNIYADDVNEVTDKTEKLLKKIEEIEIENSKLLNENEIYKKKILCVEEENEKLMSDNLKLMNDILKLKEENNLNLSKIAALEDEIKQLKKFFLFLFINLTFIQ